MHSKNATKCSVFSSLGQIQKYSSDMSRVYLYIYTRYGSWLNVLGYHCSANPSRSEDYHWAFDFETESNDCFTCLEKPTDFIIIRPDLYCSVFGTVFDLVDTSTSRYVWQFISAFNNNWIYENVESNRNVRQLHQGIYVYMCILYTVRPYDIISHRLRQSYLRSKRDSNHNVPPWKLYSTHFSYDAVGGIFKYPFCRFFYFQKKV